MSQKGFLLDLPESLMERSGSSEQSEVRRELLYCIRRFRATSDSHLSLQISRCLFRLGKVKWALQWAEFACRDSTGASQEAQLLIADIHRQQRNFVKSWNVYKKLFRGAHSAEAVQCALSLCRESNNHGYFARLASRATRRYRSSVEIQLIIARERIACNDFLGAWSNLQLTIEQEPTIIDAWELAFACASSLKQYTTALSIAKKLISLSPGNAYYYDLLGRACHLVTRPQECMRAYQMAASIQPSNLIFALNANNLCCRIAKNGNSASMVAARLGESANLVNKRLDEGMNWYIDGRYSLVPFAFHAAYSPFNLSHVFGVYLLALSRAFRPYMADAIADARPLLNSYQSSLGNRAIEKSVDIETSELRPRLRIGFLSRYFYQHSNAQAFYSYFKYLDRSRFEVIAIHRHDTVVDPMHLAINCLADEVVYLDGSLATTYAVLSCLDLNILFFTDIGMDPFDFLIP
ncbi:MAG: hypothetical protein VKM98_06215, partial [Cyanobacteriota bacterium]|nr:hypothetical protein [Cyanobacteriota bacterium]